MKNFGRTLIGLAAIGAIWASVLLVPLGVAWVVTTTLAGWNWVVITISAGWATGKSNALEFVVYQNQNPAEVGLMVLGAALVLGGVGYLITRERRARVDSAIASEFARD